MRKGLIILLAIGALASIALCGSYGWDQATETKDRITQAFVYGFVAAATLALHGAALRIWVSGWRKTGGFVGVIAMLAFMMTAFTSLGGLASRADKVLADRQDVIDTKADTKGQIDALVAEKAGLKFTRTTQAVVDAAQRSVDAAKQARGKVGDNCRKRQDAEAVALDKLAAAQTNKANTDRVIEIDAEVKRLRGLKTDGTVGNADPLRALLFTIIGAWADVFSSWQKAAFAVVYDLVLVALMIGIEALHVGTASTRSADMRKKSENVDISEPISTTAVQVIEPETPVVIPAPSRPKLIASNPAVPMGSVPAIMTENLEAMPGQRVEIADIGRRYREVCKATDRKPVSQDAFIGAVDTYCRKVGIKRKTVDGHLYLLDVQLVPSKQATGTL
jgi:hypothetical protein